MRIDPNIKPKVGVSSCLMGQSVRYDGTAKRDDYICRHLSQYLNLNNFCPEVAIGLGIPRETITLVGNLSNYRAIGTETIDRDVTDALRNYALSIIPALKTLSGFIVKSRSPSCGWHTVNLHSDFSQPPVPQAQGIFIAEIQRLMPELPLIDEEQLTSADERNSFFTRIYTHAHWQQLIAQPLTIQSILHFHRHYKYLLSVRGQQYYTELEQWLLNDSSNDLKALSNSYCRRLMTILTKSVDQQRQVNTLRDLVAKQKHLNQIETTLLNASIEQYANNHCSLVRPQNLLKSQLTTHAISDHPLHTYLTPYPSGLEPET